MIDYWSLTEALEECGYNECKITYRGFDLVDWNYKIEKRPNDEVECEKCDVVERITHSSHLASDVYFFPKSISEFEKDDFNTICESFRILPSEKERIHFLIAIRSNDGSCEMDMARSKMLMQAMEVNGYRLSDDAMKNCIGADNPSSGIRKLDSSFVYPDEAKYTVQELYKECKSFKENGDTCTPDCVNSLSRQPVLKAENIKCLLLTFEKEEKL